MKQKSQPLRSQVLALILASLAGVGFATTVTAAERDAGVKIGAEADIKGVVPDATQSGGVADGHMSPSGHEESNAQWKSGSTRGMGRAGERVSPDVADPEAVTGDTDQATEKRKRSSMQ
ncbi:MAG: hypothetical protein Q8K52_07325 [Thiobacillus sp.]|nr:hypothetical protein [Thiobacillus sp.]